MGIAPRGVDSMGKITGDAETKIAVVLVGRKLASERRSKEQRLGQPGSTPDDMFVTVAAGPLQAVGRRTFVIAVPAVLHPLPDVAGHVEKAECVGRERARRGRLELVPFAAAADAVGLCLANLIAP